MKKESINNFTSFFAGFTVAGSLALTQSSAIQERCANAMKEKAIVEAPKNNLKNS